MKILLKFYTCLLFSLLAAGCGRLMAQVRPTDFRATKTFSKSSFFAGTQMPLQFSLGYQYQFTHHLSAKVEAGILTRPYKGLIVNSLEAFGLNKYLGRVIKKAFETGTLLGIGVNHHFGDNYVGIAGRYIHLKGGGITPADALSVYFKQDFSNFDLAALPAFEFNMQSNIFNIDALLGHTFRLRNPRSSINPEIGLSKIVASRNSFSSNRPLVDASSFARNMFSQLDKEMRTAYWKHGIIPTVSVYLFYHLP